MHKIFRVDLNFRSVGRGVAASWRRMLYPAVAAAAAVAAWYVHGLLFVEPFESRGSGLRIAVTFYSLLDDVEMLACEGDEVFSISPAGIDPHEYQLAPQDVEALRDCNLVISTGHAPFEARIAELVARGELGAKLIVVPEITGLKILENPATGLPNYHMPIYDPYNYIIFLRNVSAVLAELRPQCAAIYREKARAIEANVSWLVDQAPHFSATSVALSPVVQYAVEWLGVRTRYLLVREHELPPFPDDIAAAERALATGEAQLVISVEGARDTPLGAKAEELARRYGKPIVYVSSPIEPGGFLHKIARVVEAFRQLAPQRGGLISP